MGGSTKHIILWLLLWTALSRIEGISEGFNLQFISNSKEILHERVHFIPPLPFPLTGVYVKNGPGKFDMGDRRFVHVFDGYAKLHAIQFNGAHHATFTSRFLMSNFYKKSLSKNDIASYVTSDGTIPKFGIFHTICAVIHGIDNPNINVMAITGSTREDEFLTIGDFWGGYSFNITSMETNGLVKPELSHGGQSLPLGVIQVMMSSHPVQEYGTNNNINFQSYMSVSDWFPSIIDVVRIYSLARTESIANIKVDKLPYMHCLAVSQNYAIIFAHPLYISREKILKTGAAFQGLDWEPDHGTDVYVVNIHTGKLVKFTTEAAFHMHQANSYEVGEQIFIDMVVYGNLSILQDLRLDNLRNHIKRENFIVNNNLIRYVIDMKEKTLRKSTHAYKPATQFINQLDLPIINEVYRFQKYCFIYGLSIKVDGIHTENTSLVKKNICDRTGQSDLFWIQEDNYVSEPWFIARRDGHYEDDGVLISIVMDGVLRCSYLLVLDARTMREISRAYLPTHIPFMLHGRHFTSKPLPHHHPNSVRGKLYKKKKFYKYKHRKNHISNYLDVK